MNCLTKLFQQKRRRIGYIQAFSGPMISKRDSSDAKHKDKIILRLPIIPKFNTKDDRKHSRQVLIELGYENFDEFEYVIRNK